MSRAAQPGYEFGRVSERCALSGEPLSPGDPYIAALIETDSEALERRDYARDAWDSMPERPEGLFAFWRGTVPEPTKSGRLALPFDSLTDLFEQLAESREPRRVAFRFVLALLLARKRLLTIVGERPGVLLVRPKGAGEEALPVEVIDPGLDDAALAAVTEQVAEVLRLDA